jgi:acetylornithine/N-succinyldiaminopimelate aminotransferase
MVINVPTLTDQIIQGERENIVQTYKRPPFVLVHGEGVTLYDSEGSAYTDWVAGIAVNALGYSDKGIENALIRQLAHGMIHVSNLYHTAPHVELAALLTDSSFADKVFFCNSGAEANEGAVKFARKFHYVNGDTHKTEIISLTGSFHGRTMGALALTPKEKYQKPFKPLMPGAVVAEFNNIDSVREAITENIAAIIVEPIQGEGGINIAAGDFLRGLRDLCDEHGILLIFDEIQCGVGRSGTLWSHEPSGVTPDIMTTAKPLAGGLPIGAIMVTDAVADALQPGDHGSTFAGGLIVTGAAKEVIKRINTPTFLAHINAMGDYLAQKLDSLDSPLIKERRGRGLMQAIELTIEAAPVIEAGYEHGLLLVNAGTHVIRFVPPLIIEHIHVDQLIEKLQVILAATETRAEH